MKRTIAAIIMIIASSAALSAGKPKKCVMPEFLKKGDKVVVLSPSYHMKDTTVIPRAFEVLKEWGLVPVASEHLNIADRGDIDGKKMDHYAGSDAEKVQDILAALHDDSVKAIICSRGGYGTIRLLDMIPLSEYAEHPKWIVGYSDITSILCAEVKAGVMGIHGNMCGAIGRKSGPNRDDLELRNLLFGSLPEYKIAPNEFNSTGKATGKLVGGNFITFLAMTGTDYDPFDEDGIILFVEEVEESMHAIDRMMNALILRGVTKHLSGIIFGDFTGCGKELPYSSVNEMLAQYTSKLGIPVCFGMPAGHDKLNLPLIEGAMVTMDVRKDSVTISFKGN